MDDLRRELGNRLLTVIRSQDERDVDDLIEILDWYIEAKLRERNT